MDSLAPLLIWYGGAALVLLFALIRLIGKVRSGRRALAMHKRLLKSDPKYQLLHRRQADASPNTALTYKVVAMVYLLDRLLEEGALTQEEHRVATQRAWADMRRTEPSGRR